MSQDPRYFTSPPRRPGQGLNRSSEALFHRAQLIDIMSASTSHPTRDTEQRQSKASSRHGSSPSARFAYQRPDYSEVQSMSPSSRRYKSVYPPSGMSPSREFAAAAPPPVPRHSPSQRTISIGHSSYMDYDPAMSSTRSADSSHLYRQSESPSNSPQRRLRHEPRRLQPSTVNTSRSFDFEFGNENVPHQSAPPPPPPPNRGEYDQEILLRAAPRAPRSFQFELEEEPSGYRSPQPDIPGRYPSSPAANDSASRLTDSQTGGTLEHTPKLRPQPGSYRELEPYELGMVYSNPAPFGQRPPSTNYSMGRRDDRAEPFLFEIRSPRKQDDDHSATPMASRQTVYGARNPATEHEVHPFLRPLRAGEQYATSFRKDRGSDDGANGLSTSQRTMSSGVDARTIEMARRRDELRARR